MIQRAAVTRVRRATARYRSRRSQPGEELARVLIKRGASGLGLFELAALDCHTVILSDTSVGMLILSTYELNRRQVSNESIKFHQARKFADTTFGRIAYVEKGAGPVRCLSTASPSTASRGAMSSTISRRATMYRT